MSITSAFSIPLTENAWADESTSTYAPTRGAVNMHRTSYTSNYDLSALREASEATSMWKDDAVKDLASAPSSQKEVEDRFRHTADETPDVHQAEDDSDEYNEWNFDAFEAALNEPTTTTTTTEPPAPQQQTGTQDAVDILNAAQSSLAAHLAQRTSTLPPADPAEIARVRRLLRWMIVTDYTVVPSSPSRPNQRRTISSITLSAADRAHFLHLAALSRRVEILYARHRAAPSSSRNDDADADDEHDVLSSYFWTYVHAPCAALGLHASVLLARCLDLAHFSGATGRYDGAEKGTLTLFGVGAWARRLFVDRAFVLPALFAADGDDAGVVEAYAADGGGDAGCVDAAVVREAIERRARVYFEKLEGVEGLVVERGEEGRWLFTDVCRFRLNERGRRLDARRSRGASGFGKGLYASLADKRKVVDKALKSLEGKSERAAAAKGGKVDGGGRVKDPRIDPDAACLPVLRSLV